MSKELTHEIVQGFALQCCKLPELDDFFFPVLGTILNSLFVCRKLKNVASEITLLPNFPYNCQ